MKLDDNMTLAGCRLGPHQRAESHAIARPKCGCAIPSTLEV